MRKLLLLSILMAALVVACENKNPAGPTGVGPGGVTVSQTTSSTTTTTSVPTTTSTTTTTTTVTGSLSRRYVAFQPPPNVPADMTLFFQLLTAPTGVVTSLIEQLPILGTGRDKVTENEYKVTGVYIMLNGTSGAVDGELGEALDPLTTGGLFEGRLTAKVGTCTAEREFDGPLGPQTLTWTGGNTLHDCPGSPLSFNSFTMLRTDGGAPLPSTTSTTTTTTSVPTTSTTSSTTTTTTPVCTYTLSAPGASVPAAGGSGQVSINTQATCPWTAQSFATWLTVTPPSGTGPAAVQYTAAANTNGPQRTGTLVIAGITFTVTQAASVPADLVPLFAVGTTPCAADGSTVTVQIANQGNGNAVASTATITFTNPSSPTPDGSQSVSAINAGSQVAITFALPGTCYVGSSFRTCAFLIKADATDVVFESNETNNTVSNSCSVSGIR